jgi:hypothetical protein
MEIPRPKKG